MSGVARWKRTCMSDTEKAPWQKLATYAIELYAAIVKPKSTVAKAKLCVAKPKAAAKLSAAKSKAKPKVTVAKAKAKVSKSAAKSTKSRVAGTKKPAKTIKKIKVCSCTKESSVKFSTITVCKLPTLAVLYLYKGGTRRLNWGN